MAIVHARELMITRSQWRLQILIGAGDVITAAKVTALFAAAARSRAAPQVTSQIIHGTTGLLTIPLPNDFSANLG